MKCPTCNEILLITDRQGIEIDYCQQCRGVWLDRGELDKLIERAGSIVSHRNGSEYVNNEKDVESNNLLKNSGFGVGQKRKRDNPLEEIFDFF
jgi:uncharacterized protein